MKKHNTQNNDHTQALTRIVRIHGHEFIINIDGYVKTAEFASLGHITDCEDFATMMYDLIEIFETSSEI